MLEQGKARIIADQDWEQSKGSQTRLPAGPESARLTGHHFEPILALSQDFSTVEEQGAGTRGAWLQYQPGPAFSQLEENGQTPH